MIRQPAKHPSTPLGAGQGAQIRIVSEGFSNRLWQNLAVIGEQTEDRMMITTGKFSVAFFLQAAPLAAYPLVDAPYKDDTKACVRGFLPALVYLLARMVG